MADENLQNQDVSTGSFESEQEAQEQDFDEGFDLNEQTEQTENTPQNEQQPTQISDGFEQQVQQAEQQQAATVQQPPQQVQEPVQQVQQPVQPQPSYPPQQQAPQPQPQPQPLPTVEIGDDIKEEFEKLKQISPDAAFLAQLDNPIGERIRNRLSEFGSDIAYDVAEQIINENRRVQSARQEQQRQQNAAIQAHNANYYNVMKSQHPDYFDMLTKPQRRQELMRYQQGIVNWIYSKPYREGQSLMRIAQSSRDPAEVCRLISQYKQETGGRVPRSNRRDPTGGFAVPNRGASMPPSGIGDKDSFDAGWNLNESESKR